MQDRIIQGCRRTAAEQRYILSLLAIFPRLGEARREADPEYSADGNSTYGWIVKADEVVVAGVDLVDAICDLEAFSIADGQKDMMYLLAGYKENGLEYTSWHGYKANKEGGSTSGSSGFCKGSGKKFGAELLGKRLLRKPQQPLSSFR